MIGFFLIAIPLSVASIVIVANLVSDLGEFIDPHDWEYYSDDEWGDDDSE